MNQSTKAKIESAIALKKLAGLEARLRASEGALAEALAQVDRVRAARASIVKPTAPRHRREGDKTRLVFGDLHGVQQDPAAVGPLLGDVKALQPDEIVLLGDMVDCGGFLAQHHTWGYVADSAYTYEDDIAATNAFLDALQTAAPNALIKYIEGNHEQRVERWCVTQALKNGHPKDAEGLRLRNAPEYLLRLRERGISYYRMSECYNGLSVPGMIKLGKIHYTHGSFLIGKGSVMKAHSAMPVNVNFGNTHRPESSITYRVGVGTIGAWNPGCLCKRQQLYQNTRPSESEHGYEIEFITPSDSFLHVHIPLIEGQSLLVPLLDHG